MVERHREALTQFHYPLGAEWVGRVHRVRHEEVWVTQVDICADLLKMRGGPEDAEHGHVVGQRSGGYGRRKTLWDIVVSQRGERGRHGRGYVGDPETEDWVVAPLRIRWGRHGWASGYESGRVAMRGIMSPSCLDNGKSLGEESEK
jgi:hypothetical protein